MSAAAPGASLISVVLPVYNREAFVGEALESLLAQTYGNLEVLAVVDGGSTDASADVVRSVARRDGRVRPLYTGHLTQWAARNLAVAAARGEWIAHMDDDDLTLPDRFARQMAWIEAEGLDVCGGLTKWFGQSDAILWFPGSHDAICRELLFRIAIILPTVVMRASVAKAFPYDEQLTFADLAQLSLVSGRHRLGNVPAIVLRERAHGDQFHRNLRESMAEDSRVIRLRHFDALFPGASPGERARFHDLVAGRPCRSAGDLRALGDWLADLADLPEPFFRQRIALRWLKSCTASASLGPEVHRVYREVVSRIDPGGTTSDPWLRLASTLRVRGDSRAFREARAAVRVLRHRWRARR